MSWLVLGITQPVTIVTGLTAKPLTPKLYEPRWRAAIVLAVFAVLAGVLVASASASGLQLSSRLTWRSVSTPVGGARITTEGTIWMQAGPNGKVDKLLSRTIANGTRVELTLWPFGARDQLAIVTSGKCQLTSPPTPPTVGDIITDTVGPIPLPSSSGHGFTHVHGMWRSVQGAITVVITQKGPLSSRIVDMYLNTAKQTSHPLVDRFTHISYSRAPMPRSLKVTATTICK